MLGIDLSQRVLNDSFMGLCPEAPDLELQSPVGLRSIGQSRENHRQVLISYVIDSSSDSQVAAVWVA